MNPMHWASVNDRGYCFGYREISIATLVESLVARLKGDARNRCFA